MINLRCQNCGYETDFEDEEQAYDNDWWQDEDGKWYCNDCHHYCEYCETEYPDHRIRWSENLDCNICQECAEEHCVYCHICNDLENKEEAHQVIDARSGAMITMCRRCYENAQERGQITARNGQRFYNRDADNRNENIVQTNLHPEAWAEINTCPECMNSSTKCARCLQRMAEETKAEETTLWVYDTLPRSYHHSLHNHFKETRLRQEHEHPYLYYGCECEYLFRDSTPIEQIAKEYIKATGGLFVAEFDRSVSDQGNGIEFISRPLSYKKWMDESTYLLLEEGKKVLEKYHAYNPQPSTCGLHVHMSLVFFERNTKKSVKEIKSDIDWMFQIFQSEIEKISQRKYTRYCASKAYRLKEVMKNIKMNGYGFNLNPSMSISKGEITQSMGSGDTHHDAIIQTNRTIEVRTFNSTIKTEELLATIEFCRCIAHAARNMKLTKKNTLGDILWCKDSKYLPGFIKKTKVDYSKKFDNKLEVKI